MKKLYILFLLISNFLFAQNTADFDISFLSGIGADRTVKSFNIQLDGKIVIGGYFTSYNGTTSHSLARLNTNGTIDNGFNNMTTIFDNTSEIYDVEILPDSKIIAAGYLKAATTLNQTKSILKFNENGSEDTSFNIGSGFSYGTFSPIVSDVAIQSDGKIIAVGFFTTVNGQNKSGIVRLNTDGSIDGSFNTGTGFSSPCRKVAIQSDGKILVAGGFTSYNGTNRNRIIRLNSDGSIDASFDIGSGFNNQVYSLKIQPNGKILIGGNFTNYNGETVYRLIRLNTDGSSDGAFFTGNGVNNNVKTIELQSDGKILIGGTFTSFGINNTKNLARLQSTGTLDTNFDTSIGVGLASNTEIECLKIQNDGKILISGFFDFYRTINSKCIARIFESTLSTDNFNISNLKTFPNPTTGIINFNLEENASILIFDLTGKQLLQTQKERGLQTIDITGFEKGVYILKVKTDNKTQTQQILKG